jgi:hypothetical protein
MTSENGKTLSLFIHKMRAIALYRCAGEDETELSFQAGDIIYKGTQK